jgi:serine/threonine-protein kinase
LLELLAAHRGVEVAPRSRWNGAVPPDLEQVVLKCLAKNPSDRFQDSDELRKALNRCGVATRWGPDEAAAWWKAASRQPPQAPAVKAPVDGTMDYQPDSS